MAALERIRSNTALAVDATTFVSWAVANKGDAPVENLFYIDLYFDGVAVARWGDTLLDTDSLSVITDWDSLHEVVRLRPGDHTLKLVVDPTHLIPETDETDNEVELVLTWLPAATAASPTPMPGRLPDLAPYTPSGWDAPLVASSYEDQTAAGPLSVDTPTYVVAAVRNQGLASTPEDVWVHLYVDDVLVDMRLTRGMLIEDPAARSRFQDIGRRVPLSPGVHTLKVVADPNDLIVESDEENNVYERQFVWGSGPVAGATPVATVSPPALPEAQALPNLVPGWRFGWDGPIVVSHEPGSFLDGPLTVDRRPLVDVVVFNRSTLEAGPYSVDLYFDGEKIQRFEMVRGNAPRSVSFIGDWDGLEDKVDLTEGTHRLKIVIDPDNQVPESDETDNTYERAFSWAAGQVETAGPVTYDEETLRQMLSGLPELLDVREHVVGESGDGYAEDVLRVADAGYYLITGRSLKDERVTVLLLGKQKYLDWIDTSFEEELAVRDPSSYEALAARREMMRTRATGFKTRFEGKVAVIVDAERGVADVINSLAHELGHMLQDLSTPNQAEAETSYPLQGVREAEAQQFQRTVWLALEEFTGLSLMSYPDYDNFRESIDQRLTEAVRNYGQDEHALGLLLQWLVVLDDPALADLRERVVAGSGLDAAESLRLFEYLVNLPPGSAQAYVSTRLEGLRGAINTIRATAWRRLQPAAEVDFEGPKDVRVTALLMP